MVVHVCNEWLLPWLLVRQPKQHKTQRHKKTWKTTVCEAKTYNPTNIHKDYTGIVCRTLCLRTFNTPLNCLLCCTLQAFLVMATSITPLPQDQFPVGLQRKVLSKEIHCTEFDFLSY